MKKALLLLILIPGLLFSQENSKDATPSKSIKMIPTQVQYSETFDIRNVYFNKSTEIHGKGEILEVEFELKNKTDDPMDLYIYIIATFEKVEKTKSSFEMPIPPKERLRTFVPYPLDLENFQYPVLDKKGNQVQDDKGKAKMHYLKYPRDPKLGINPETGRPYHLDEKLFIRTTHLSKFRVRYDFFNEVVILIFDKNGEPQYKREYKLEGFRRH